jgi:CheY-like chemotaxis protein
MNPTSNSNENTKPLHILLADDDIDDCNFFKNALNELPISTQLTIVNDGDKLMQLLTNETTELPHVLFLDINMPRKNGFECLSEIKASKKLNSLPVVMFSTSYSPDKINMLFKIGAHVYIHKPSDFKQLVQVINHAIPMVEENIFSNGQLKYILNA